MKVLVLGGTKFLGRAVVDAALQAGHEVTLFNRGQLDPSAYPGLEHLRGDRTTAAGLDPLRGRTWDAAIDTAPYLPRDVRSMTAALTVSHYTLVSSISTMASHAAKGQDEDAPLAKLTPEQEKEVDALSADGPIPAAKLGEFYGALKALCEAEARNAFGANALIVRPGLIVGPHDPTDRFTYWPVRFMRGGDVLAPGKPDRPVQFIDVRDLAEWMVRMIEAKKGETFLATGRGMPFGDVLEACARIARERGAPPSRLHWVDDAKLVAGGLGPWMEMPLWIPSTDPAYAGFMTERIDRALAAGLTFRPLEDTIRATLDWNATRPAEAPRAAGLSPEKEAQLLSA